MRQDAEEAVNLEPEAAAQTLDRFIVRVIEAARNRDDFDATLLNILTGIVKEVPADDAVVLAATQIEALADQRASPPEKELSDSEDNA